MLDWPPACKLAIIQVYSVNVMTHVIALEAGQSSQGTFEPITPVPVYFQHDDGVIVIVMQNLSFDISVWFRDIDITLCMSCTTRAF